MADKKARIAWAVMKREQDCGTRHASAKPPGQCRQAASALQPQPCTA